MGNDLKSAGKRSAVLAVAGMLLAACAPPAPPPAMPSEVSAPTEFPERWYRQAAAQGIEVMQVDAARSLVAIEVHRAGALARLGHEHVVAIHDLQGDVAPDQQRADLYARLDRMTVDEAGLRAEHGLTQSVGMEAIEGTRRNMLDKVLETPRFPYVFIQVRGRAQDGAVIDVAITLHGRTQRYPVPVRVVRDAEGLTVQGRLALRQTDFGIVPFAALGGALQVGDQLDLSFRVFARRKG